MGALKEMNINSARATSDPTQVVRFIGDLSLLRPEVHGVHRGLMYSLALVVLGADGFCFQGVPPPELLPPMFRKIFVLGFFRPLTLDFDWKCLFRAGLLTYAFVGLNFGEGINLRPSSS
ncbi:hypothetical protein Scep_011605 [Stephania cephalantha]|uniref:Uncharacterized protein n=1 Tax=Stephania cephalantha TaxID=152367 RepID=A0AAP0JFN2_9MAGN